MYKYFWAALRIECDEEDLVGEVMIYIHDSGSDYREGSKSLLKV